MIRFAGNSKQRRKRSRVVDRLKVDKIVIRNQLCNTTLLGVKCCQRKMQYGIAHSIHDLTLARAIDPKAVQQAAMDEIERSLRRYVAMKHS